MYYSVHCKWALQNDGLAGPAANDGLAGPAANGGLAGPPVNDGLAGPAAGLAANGGLVGPAALSCAKKIYIYVTTTKYLKL